MTNPLILLGIWFIASGALGVPLLADGPGDSLIHTAGRLAIGLGAGAVVLGLSL